MDPRTPSGSRRYVSRLLGLLLVLLVGTATGVTGVADAVVKSGVVMTIAYAKEVLYR